MKALALGLKRVVTEPINAVKIAINDLNMSSIVAPLQSSLLEER
jgi:hypothetical protein